MTDKQEKIRAFIKKRKTNRKIELFIHIGLLMLTVSLLVFFGKYLGAFLPLAVALVLLIYRTVRLFCDKTVSVFTKELRGTVVRNDKKCIVHDSQRVGGVGLSRNLRPYQSYSTELTVGAVFVRTDSGEVLPLGKYHEDVAEFIEEGDEVVRFEGSRYPLILNEPASRQKWLCPACGNVSPDECDCSVCGLEFSLIG